jgi:hypothetical protein
MALDGYVAEGDDTLLTYTPLAGERLQPLDHFSKFYLTRLFQPFPWRSRVARYSVLSRARNLTTDRTRVRVPLPADRSDVTTLLIVISDAVGLNSVQNFFSVYRHIPRRVYANANLIAFYPQHRDGDIVPDDKGFTHSRARVIQGSRQFRRGSVVKGGVAPPWRAKAYIQSFSGDRTGGIQRQDRHKNLALKALCL